MFTGDPNGRGFEVAMVLNAPLQSFLNAAFSSEKATSKHMDAIMTNLVGPRGEDVTTKELEEKASRKLVNMLTGATGRDAVKQMFDLVRDYKDDAWSSLAFQPPDDRFRTSLAMVSCMGDAWYRLVFVFGQRKYWLLNVCLADEMTASVVDVVVRPVLRRTDECDRCVDIYFAQPWPLRLSNGNPRTRKQSHRA